MTVILQKFTSSTRSGVELATLLGLIIVTADLKRRRSALYAEGKSSYSERLGCLPATWLILLLYSFSTHYASPHQLSTSSNGDLGCLGRELVKAEAEGEACTRLLLLEKLLLTRLVGDAAEGRLGLPDGSRVPLGQRSLCYLIFLIFIYIYIRGS
jgi:hypothetical protein